MKSIVVFLFFLAAFMIISGVYEQKLAIAQQNKKIEYRFVPRTYYEEQMAGVGDVGDKYGSMFQYESPWTDRTMGPIIDIQKPYSASNNNSVEPPKIGGGIDPGVILNAPSM